jgi:hypothetical protein
MATMAAWYNQASKAKSRCHSEQLLARYTSTINLARAVDSSKNLTDNHDTMLSQTEDLTIERDTTIANSNALSTQLMQLKTEADQTLALATATCANTGNTDTGPFSSCKGQSDPETFSGQDRNKLRSFVALLQLKLVNRPGKFPNDQSKLH